MNDHHRRMKGISAVGTREQAAGSVNGCRSGRFNRVNQGKKMTTRAVSGRRYFTKAWLLERSRSLPCWC